MAMPKETDAARIRLLARILLGAIGCTLFDARAFVGSKEPDDLGLDRLFARKGKLTRRGMEQRLRDALARSLRTGNVPSRVEVKGDQELTLDPETRYEFRLVLEGVRVYVKTVLELGDPDDPMLTVKCVKRQN